MNYCGCKEGTVDLMKDAVRVGRAHYICPKCKKDVTIFLTLMYEAQQNDEERRNNCVKNKKHKSKSVKQL